MSDVWYRNYDEYNTRVSELRGALMVRCAELQLDYAKVLNEFGRESLARAVHESNWQEGIELDAGKTQKLEMIAFDEIEDVIGPHLDMNKVLRFHRDAVVKMKRNGVTQEEIGAYNLARAHHAIEWVGSDLASRFAAGLAQLIKQLHGALPNERLQPEALNPDQRLGKVAIELQRVVGLIENLEKDESAIWMPMTAPPKNQGNMLQQLLSLTGEELLSPIKTAYIHFFHRLVMMGILPSSKSGRYRAGPVHVGNSDLYFPTPAALASMMREFCQKFPAILAGHARYDPILMAAKVSHRFVAIHPYEDGNGRVSRLLMNLVLWKHHPPVALKADKKGRHKYAQALHKADRGDARPMAALIALSIIEMYEKLLRSLGGN